LAIKAWGTAIGLIRVAEERNQEGAHMAAEGELDREDFVHRKGYERFIGLMKWGTIISAIIGILVVIAISK
jgi:hypothetical protein